MKTYRPYKKTGIYKNLPVRAVNSLYGALMDWGVWPKDEYVARSKIKRERYIAETIDQIGLDKIRQILVGAGGEIWKAPNMGIITRNQILKAFDIQPQSMMSFFDKEKFKEAKELIESFGYEVVKKKN